MEKNIKIEMCHFINIYFINNHKIPNKNYTIGHLDHFGSFNVNFIAQMRD